MTRIFPFWFCKLIRGVPDGLDLAFRREHLDYVFHD